jgi:negative regulator of sigma E activity
MTDSRTLGAGAFGPEPAQDPDLGALLRDVIGDTPNGAVNWTTLAARICDRIGRQAAAPWWSYATQWERRVIPLALAAGIVAAAALWTTTSASATQITSASELATAVANGTPAEDAASQFARSITNAVDLTAGVPE